MESFLVCENSRCHMVFDLGENGRVSLRSKTIVNECPECGNPWSRTSPFCSKPLEVTWRRSYTQKLLKGPLRACHFSRRFVEAHAFPAMPGLISFS